MTSDTGIQPLRTGDPRELGGYALDGRVGRGGMGTVYLAHGAGGERVAVKVINPELADDETFRDRFRREVESARRVRRFCTAPVLDARLDGEPLFIVTEFVDGPDLDTYVRRSGPMRGSDLEHLAVGVATALTAIHGAGVVHRDLKPANVLLSSTGPRVIDFGIARALDTLPGATRTGQLIGTPAFMAPELISGGRASPASDVFAWGCVVAYAGTGRTPFEGATVAAVLYQITHAEPGIDGLDDGLRDLVLRTLAKDPAERPSAQDVLDRLTGRSHADTARTAEAVGRTWALPVAGPTRPEAVSAGAGPTVAAGSTTAGSTTADAGGPARGLIGRLAPRRRPWVLGGVGAATAAVLGLGGVLAFGGPGGPPAKTVPVFDDDFSNNESGWSGSTWISGSGYAEAGYRIDADDITSARREAAPVKTRLPARLLVGARAKVQSGPPYGQLGLFCRGAESGGETSGYDFLVRADGAGVVIRKEAGTKGNRELATKPSAAGFTKGHDNRLQAACEQADGGVRLRLWINGHLAAEASDTRDPLPDGTAGLLARLDNPGGDGHVRTRFDDFSLAAIR